MSLQISEQDEQNIKAAINIIEVIAHYEQLKKKGSDYVCKCPFHDENTPSFNVSPVKGIYKCFGCGASGDAIKFIREREKLNYLDAMKWLADFYHIPLDETTPRNYSRPLPPKKPKQTAPVVPVSYVPKEVFNASLGSYDSNNFVKFLHTLFHPCIVEALIEKYFIGTSKYYPGGSVFYQVDEAGNIRTGKIMPYDPVTGKRNREKKPASNWVHSVLKIANYNLQQCLFGLHLLNEDTAAPVAVVESEKTAIIASVFIPSFTWIATGGKGYEKYNKDRQINEVSELLRTKFKPLAGRNVVLFPDLGAVEDWQELAVQLSDITNISVNNLLQDAAKEYQLPDKSDLCDYLTSDAARRELIDEFKEALIKNTDDSDAGQWQIWEQFRDKGLRTKDRLQVGNELLSEGYFIESDEIKLQST